MQYLLSNPVQIISEVKVKTKAKKNKLKRIVKISSLVCLLGAFSNTMPLACTIAGKRGVSEATKYFPLWGCVPSINYEQEAFDRVSINFPFIYGENYREAVFGFDNDEGFYSNSYEGDVSRNEAGIRIDDFREGRLE